MKKARILIVDDEASARSALERILTLEGFATVSAPDGASALDEARRELPDIVLTDLAMPGMGGIELCRRLHDLDQDLPVSVTTGVSGVEVAIGAMRAGAEDYLVKPLDVDAVLWAMERALGRRAAKLERSQLLARAEERHQTALATAGAYRDLLSTVSHDLRTPLNVIRLWAGELEREPGADERTRRIAQNILRSTTRMSLLLENVLDEGRARAGRAPLDLSVHNVSDILTDVHELRPLAVQRRVDIDVAAPPRPFALRCDRVRVGQVLANLIANAIRYSPPGGVVRVRTSRASDTALFEVADDGPGITAEAIPRLFERFWRDPSSTGNGLGLGLYIAKQIVVSHGGNIDVESEVGRGSTFRFVLPLRGPPDQPPKDGDDLPAESRLHEWA